MARQTSLPPSLPPIGATREVAAAYLSISPVLFDELVRTKALPGPKRIGRRRVWDLEEVRFRFKSMPGEDDGDVVDTTWDD